MTCSIDHNPSGWYITCSCIIGDNMSSEWYNKLYLSKLIWMRYYFGWCHPDYLRQHRVKSTSSTSSSTSPYLQYSGGVSLYAWCRYSWVFMLLKCGAGVTTRQVWSESSHGVTRPMISKNWTDFILKWTGLYTLELTTHWPQSWLCGNTLVVMTHTKFPLSPFDQEYNLIKPDPVCITHQ